jgi:hypothetical protein
MGVYVLSKDDNAGHHVQYLICTAISEDGLEADVDVAI